VQSQVVEWAGWQLLAVSGQLSGKAAVSYQRSALGGQDEPGQSQLLRRSARLLLQSGRRYIMTRVGCHARMESRDSVAGRCNAWGNPAAGLDRWT